MMIELFDVQDNRVVPTAIARMIPEISHLLDYYGADGIKALSYVCFTTCPDSGNPYINYPEDEREAAIIADIDPPFCLEDPPLLAAQDKLRILYETPLLRLQQGSKKMLDEMANNLGKPLTFGKDGNETAMRGIMDKFDIWAEKYNKLSAMVKEEQRKVKGDRIIPDHQREGYKETKDYSE